MIKKKLNNSRKHEDRTFLLVITSLIVFSLFIIYNATAYYAEITFNNAFKFVLLQLAWIFAGSVGFYFFSKFDYTKLKSISFIFFIASFLLLILLGFVGVFLCRRPEDIGIIFSPCINGASRWLFLNPAPLPQIPFIGVIGFQPSEFAKLSIIMYLSTQLYKFNSEGKKNTDPFLVYIITASLVAFLLFLQPNMSTAILVFIIATMIYFVSGFPIKPLLVSLPFFSIVGILVTLSSAYRRARFFTLLGLSHGGEQETGYQIKQILIALGSGGFFGLGFGQSRQKFQYLPEVASDSIFAIIGEEFGFLGAAIIILVFGYLLYQGLKIAKNAPDMLGRMLAVGITSWIGFQFFINIAAMAQLIPLTGMPIPLISYGGSSMVFSMIGLGILYNIQKQSI